MRSVEQDAPREARGSRALCGWSPPSLPANSGLKRRVDKVRLGGLAAVSILVIVVGLLNVAAHLPVRPALVVDGLAGLVAGGWCSLNYWRCRHAHCVVTGPGWLAFAALALVEAGLGHSLIAGYEQPVFTGILAVAVLLEMLWYVSRHTHAVAWPPR